MNITDANPQADSHTTSDPQADSHTTSDPQADRHTSPRPLCRPVHDRMLAGVAAGLANYLGADVLAVRVVLAVLTVVGGAGLPIYLAGWLLIPEEGAELSIASELIQSLHARSL